MKRIIQTLLLFCTVVNIYSQSLWDVSKPDHNFGGGIEIGINYSSLDIDDATSSRNGFHGGLFLEYNIIKSFALSSGVSYVVKGFDGKRGEARMSYIQVPILASWRFETPTKVMFHLNIGPYIAYGIGGNIFFTPFTLKTSYYFDQDSFGGEGFFKDYDAGVILGGTIQLNKIRFGLSYEYGLVDIAEVFDSMHNRNISISLGYIF